MVGSAGGIEELPAGGEVGAGDFAQQDGFLAGTAGEWAGALAWAGGSGEFEQEFSGWALGLFEVHGVDSRAWTESQSTRVRLPRWGSLWAS